MQSMWKRTRVLDHARLGRKIVEWTLDKAARPATFDEFKTQLNGILEVVDETKTPKFELIDTPMDTVVIRLPPAEIIRQARDQYTDPATTLANYPFSPYLRVDRARMEADHITVEELFYSAVGDYTTTECE